ncbi:MAG: hypothetical protein KDE00_04225 [Rhodobacteraceae bacterium]|nr:hypothetical protein [Paracoccaceae bacterium]
MTGVRLGFAALLFALTLAVVDHFFLGYGIAVGLARKFADFVEYLAIWR